TNSVTAFLEQAREALDRRLPEPAVMAAPDGGGRAWFLRSALKGLVLHRQVRTHLGDAEAFRDDPLPLAALPPEVGGLGVGWFWSPSSLDGDQRIGDPATARRLGEPLRQIPVPFVIIVPAGAAPAGGWPLALMGHGYGGEMFGSALRIAGTLARHGIAT